ncbi:AbrB/MazE/SpoVT family DNA-binding domain-containing protein [Lactobacillus helveticus]|uniref:AbrB/MazE/SpoVT family DNA-binding domain-containing protein n=1 Tax=Lactobacillus helveticus TaxID=1587 RepID=UPI001C645FC9|nr:AbrB/MazE/SpoVT family DNA-binding domain-containing protein [Lactobacillus helveticus]MBW8014509.1 AbrB/MazE/SpoVT family DNA-binding domain-containing protein [Lactobacillus helveticus]
MVVKNAKHIFKSGNSYAIRISKEDRSQLGIDESSNLIKTISPDKKTISFTVVNPNENQTIDAFAKKFMADHKKAFDILKDM